MLWHTADSLQWQMVNSRYPNFGGDARNLRLDLLTNWINSHGNMSSTHSTWQDVLTIYNLPPCLFMKHKFLILSLLISGPKQSRNDIDVYLAPLIKDLKVMWEERVKVFDAHSRYFFYLRAIFFRQSMIFSVYDNLSGYNMKGHRHVKYVNKRHFLSI